jgi:hypothetical protein
VCTGVFRSGTGKAGTSAPARLRRAYAGEADLGAGDRTNAERLGRVGELERATDCVVVGERQRVVAEVGGARGELVGKRCPVEERIR